MTHPLTLDHAAFREGETAYDANLSVDSNPYNKTNWQAKKHESWHKGYIYKKSRVELYPRRKNLEKQEERYADENLAEKWLQLATDFQAVEDISNIGYCMVKYRQHMKKFGLEIPEEYQEKHVGPLFNVDLGSNQFDWQTDRKDTK